MQDSRLSLIVDLGTVYAGNHEQELAGYLLGAGDHPRSERQFENFEEWASENYGEDEEACPLRYSTISRSNEDYGYQVSGLDPHNAHCAEIYLDDYSITDEWREALLKRVGDGNITLKSYDKEYKLQIVGLEIRTYLTIETQEPLFDIGI